MVPFRHFPSSFRASRPPCQTHLAPPSRHLPPITPTFPLFPPARERQCVCASLHTVRPGSVSFLISLRRLLDCRWFRVFSTSNTVVGDKVFSRASDWKNQKGWKPKLFEGNPDLMGDTDNTYMHLRMNHNLGADQTPCKASGTPCLGCTGFAR